MKKTILSAAALIALTPSLALADNIANCEVVLMEPVLENDEPTGAEMASFRPAAEFLSSVYDEEHGHVKEINGYPIRGVLCQRNSIIPSLRDYPVIATGIPFSLSENFDSPDSRLITLYYKDGEFLHKYAGEELGKDDQSALDDVMEAFNLQAHDLKKPEEKDKDAEAEAEK